MNFLDFHGPPPIQKDNSGSLVGRKAASLGMAAFRGDAPGVGAGTQIREPSRDAREQMKPPISPEGCF
jgi:hypothetical protein